MNISVNVFQFIVKCRLGGGRYSWCVEVFFCFFTILVSIDEDRDPWMDGKSFTFTITVIIIIFIILGYSGLNRHRTSATFK